MIHELFHELGDAAFAAAKELGQAFEAAIAEKARQRVVTQDALNAKTRRPPDNVFKILLENARPEWRLHSVVLDAYEEITIVRSRLPCGHIGHTRFEDRMVVLCHDTREICEYIIQCFERPPERRCYCVERL